MTYNIDISVPTPINSLVVYTAINGGSYSTLVSFVYSPGSFPRTEQATLVVPPGNDHVVNNVQVNFVCGVENQFGDIRYLYNAIPTPCTFTPGAGPVIDIEFTPLCDAQGNSVKEYTLSYKPTGSPGSPTVITIPIATVIADPNYIANGTYQLQLDSGDGILAGTSYDLSLGTTLEFQFNVDVIVDPLGYIIVNQPTPNTTAVVTTP